MIAKVCAGTDPGKDRAMAPDVEEPNFFAGKLLSTKRSKSQHRPVRRSLQPQPISRELEKSNAR